MFWAFITVCLLTITLLQTVSHLSGKHCWARLLGELEADRCAGRNLFGDQDNPQHLLGRLYGYVHAKTEGIGLSNQQRHCFTVALLQELLLISDLSARIKVFVDQDDHDFFKGWYEGKQAGSPEKGYLNSEDKAFARLFDNWIDTDRKP